MASFRLVNPRIGCNYFSGLNHFRLFSVKYEIKSTGEYPLFYGFVNERIVQRLTRSFEENGLSSLLA
ncbi:hypothetical protein YC2023_002672 [Brassica napus]